MKINNNHIESEIDSILQSASNQAKVSLSPFFTTRVMGRVEQLEDNTSFFPRIQMILRPALVFLMIVNIVNFYVYTNTSDTKTDSADTIEVAMNDYAAWSNDFILSDDLYWDN